MAKELTIQTLRQAQAGNRQSLSAVSERAREKVYTYIYRLTLDYHVTQDMTQETVMEMIKSLPQLDVPHMNGFWAWTFRTALGKVQHHFRPQGARRLARKTTSDTAALESHIAEHGSTVNAIIRAEVRNAVTDAMKAIKLKYRNILVLRCFDNLPYSQISVILGGNELQARLLFFRAKRSLKGQLERHGFKRDSLLSMLTLFAGLTLGTGKKAGARNLVRAGSLETGLGLGLASLVTSKGVIAGACALLIAGVAVSRIKPESKPDSILREQYSHLYPLLGRAEFVLPSRVVAAHDPDEDGFLVVEQTSPELARQRLQTDQITLDLVNQPRMGPALAKDHWIELGFDGPIRDGSGPDLLLRVQGCRSLIRVFVTDGADGLYELRRPRCLRRGVCRHEHILTFNLDGLSLPFEPRAVRLLGAFTWGPYGGIRFYSVQARVQRPEPSPL